jgi:hypothetical protein
VLEEEAAGRPLAHQPPLQVGEDHEHGVDLALLDLGFEFLA